MPAGFTLDSYFEHIAREGFARRLEGVRALEAQGRLKHAIGEYEQRLSREIGIIQQMKFSGYFLIVWDFIHWRKRAWNSRRAGARIGGGIAGGYSMGITDIDPLQNELLFERFLNPERVSMPDIDVDFCMNRRGEVIDYVTRKYGRENVAQIITFGTMAAKAAIKDTGRAMGIPYADVDRIAKMVPAQLNITLEKALAESPSLEQAYQNEAQVKELIDTARRLEGIGSQRRGTRGGGGDFSSATDRPGSTAQNQERRNCDRLRHEGDRENGTAQDGLSWADHADHPRRCAGADPKQGPDISIWRRCLWTIARHTKRYFTRR